MSSNAFLDSAPSSLKVGNTISGFAVQQIDEVPEISTAAYVMKHVSTGARLLYMQNADSNKTFSISFKTPPSNDTGVFHILEHSVLCGSDSYPVKEPFVDLLKSSMQTFLNAMTFPDKTMYPVSSTNERDLQNLASIYIDAVLNPAIYTNPKILEQEGWHYEVGSKPSRTLSTNGVVYSEMKGALSDPDSVLNDALMRALFPDSPYSYESGGDPKNIPNLTYEEFLDTHARHYRLDNSYTLLYGDMDIEQFLAFLDKKYSQAKVRSLEPPNSLPLQNAVRAVGVRQEMATTPDNASVAQGYVITTAKDREKLVAAQIIINTLMGSNEAPLKRAILDSDIAGSASHTVIMEVLQPFVLLQINGLKSADAEVRFRQIVHDVCTQISNDGFNQELLLSTISHMEFCCREGNLSCEDGVGYAMSTLVSWLYDDSMSTTHLHYADLLDKMRVYAKDGSGYFEKLLREVIVDNPHMASVELVPVDADPSEWETQKMSELRKTLSDGELDKIAKNVDELRQMQEAPDSPEAKATIPKLTLKDIGDAPLDAGYNYKEDKHCILHNVDTHGIVYASRFFDLGALEASDISYVWLLAKMLGKVDTDKHNAADLITLMKGELGNLSFAMRVYENLDNVTSPRVFLEVNGSALSQKLTSLVDIYKEIVLTSCLDDEQRIQNILEQEKVYTEQLIVNAAHMVSGTRLGSMFRPAQVLQDQLIGIEHYRFVKDMLNNFSDKSRSIIAKLSDLAAKIFIDSPNSVYSFAGSEDDYKKFWDTNPSLGKNSNLESTDFNKLSVNTHCNKNEAFIIPSNVAFVASGNDYMPYNTTYTGANGVASNALGLDYLWTQVRVKGGAYGAAGRVPRSKLALFYSYRDPHIDQTLMTFKNAGAWLQTYEPDPETLEGLKISTVSSSDAPQKPRVKVAEENAKYFCGISKDEKAKHRQEAIDATLGDLHKIGDTLCDVMENCTTCAFASSDMISQSKIDFDVVDLFA